MVEKISDGKGTTQYRYSKCPVCGSKKRHYEDISEKAIKMDMAPAGFLMAFEHDVRLVADPKIFEDKPIGTEVPKISSVTEVCKDCGVHYSPLVIAGKDKKTVEVKRPKIFLPGQGG